MTQTVELEDPQGVINSLQERIAQLQSQLEYASRRTEEERAEHAFSALGRLRIHAVIPLYVGDQPIDDVVKEIQGEHLLRDVGGAIWSLERSPLSAEVKEAVKMAAKNGLSRW